MKRRARRRWPVACLVPWLLAPPPPPPAPRELCRGRACTAGRALLEARLVSLPCLPRPIDQWCLDCLFRSGGASTSKRRCCSSRASPTPCGGRCSAASGQKALAGSRHNRTAPKKKAPLRPWAPAARWMKSGTGGQKAGGAHSRALPAAGLACSTPTEEARDGPRSGPRPNPRLSKCRKIKASGQFLVPIEVVIQQERDKRGPGPF